MLKPFINMKQLYETSFSQFHILQKKIDEVCTGSASKGRDYDLLTIPPALDTHFIYTTPGIKEQTAMVCYSMTPPNHVIYHIGLLEGS